ncbi:hypothetical protein BDZ90DRAFT_232007 [Jaminaea rosea]|uniref:Uncharacterized protein n=1 Tax=Jaminaea rosea TaxID=1569628 RepID=A0A316UQL5_9BASI|nr:hypothetical protein BDZ90DRAFT_232007 [Jaminaea rosea]PWN27580.1 hypothetical protein BDZ90DRAFT_232007 [Jaminaea rosea]
MSPQFGFSFNAPSQSSCSSGFAASRKRGRMDDDVDDCNAGHAPEQRKLSLAAHRSTAGANEVATFHPLGAEENLRMLASLGLLPGGAQHGASSGGSPGSVSSANSSPISSTISLHGGYFPSSTSNSAYPNVQPYAAQQAFLKAQQAASCGGGMDIDPTPSRARHGPHCGGIPQLYVSRGQGCALYARCPSCDFSWEVVEAQTLSYSC